MVWNGTSILHPEMRASLADIMFGESDIDGTIMTAGVALPDLLRDDTLECLGSRNPAEDPAEPKIEEVLQAIHGDVLQIETGMSFKKCLNLFGHHTRDEVLSGWEKLEGVKRVHLSGGWSNPMSLETNLTPDLPGNVQFQHRVAGDVMQGIVGNLRPPIHFDYPHAWRGMWEAEKSRIADANATGKVDAGLDARVKKFNRPFEEVNIGDLLRLPAPDYWVTWSGYGPQKVMLGRTTNGPSDSLYAHGFILIQQGLRFLDQETKLVISNSTGARAVDTTAMNLVLLYLTCGPEIAAEAYCRSAVAKQQKIESTGGKITWDEQEVRSQSEDFVRSVAPVAKEIKQALEVNPGATGVQYAMQTLAHRNLPVGVGLFPPAIPHAFVADAPAQWRQVNVRALYR